MAAPLGWFDPNLVLTTSFDKEEIVRAWFDPEWVGLSFSDTITEAGTAADSGSAIVNFVSSLTETASATDAPSAITISADTEAASATDTTSSAAVFADSVTETAVAIDAEDGPTNYVFDIFVSETASATEIVDRSIGSAPLGWFDPNLVLVTEFDDQDLSVSRTAFDPLWIGVTFSDSITEQTNAADTDSSTVDFVGSDSETVSASDTTNSAVSFGPTITETAAATDTDTSTADFVSGISVSEAGSATESVAELANYVVVESEAGSTSDTIDASGNFVASASELASASDSITEQADYVVSITEAASAADQFLTGQNFSDTILEQASAADQIIGGKNVTDDVHEQALAVDHILSGSAFFAAVLEPANAGDLLSPNVVPPIIAVVYEQTIARDMLSANVIPAIIITRNNMLAAPVAASIPINTKITAIFLEAVSPGFTADQIIYQVTTAPIYGILLEDGVPLARHVFITAASLTSLFSQADLNTGRISYQNTTPAASDQFGFQVSDPAGHSTSGNFSVSVQSRTIQVVGDPDTGDGLVETPPQDFFKAGGMLISVDTTAVTDHEDHTGVHTANGSSFFHISGKPVNFKTNADTCGHTRNGSQEVWFNVGG